MILGLQQGLKADGIEVSLVKLCEWFGVARRTLYYRATKGLDLAKKMDSRYFCTVNPKEGVMSKRFSEQFKQEAVQLVSAERPIRQVASYLGIGYSTLDKWVRAHRERTGQLVALTQEQKRIRELERQVAHLQEVNDILKKATVYFANPANR